MGTQDLAVQGLASPYFSVVGIVGGLLVTGMQTLSAKAYGAGDVKRAEGFYSMAMTAGALSPSRLQSPSFSRAAP